MKKLAFAFILTTVASIGAVSTLVAADAPAAAASGIRKPTGSAIGKFWSKIPWAQLSPEEQKAWGVLGWTAANWNGPKSSAPASEKTDWAKLTKPEQEAAAALGYDEKSWQAE